MILTAAESRVALGLAASITDADRGLIEILLPMVDAAIAAELRYNPEYHINSAGQWYPRQENIYEGNYSGVWDTSGNTAFLTSLNRSTILQLSDIPVRSIEEIRVDYIGGFGQKPNSFGAGMVWAVGERWYQDLLAPGQNMTGHVFSLTGWPTEPGSILVKYTAGYTQWELSGRATSGTDPETNAAASGLNASAIKMAAQLTMVKAFKTLKANAKQGAAGFTGGPLTGERLGAYSYSADGSLLRALAGMQVSIPPEAKRHLEPYIHFGMIGL